MKLTSIRENYGKLLTAFKDAGIKLTESQQADLDTFMLAFESKLEQTKTNAIKATKKVVEENLSKEYQKVFESILKHQKENARLSSKIQKKVTAINESKKIASKVDEYLNLYLEEQFPKKQIVDYDKLRKLETLVESVKETLTVNDERVEKKAAELDAKYVAENKKLEDKISSLEKQLNESMTRELTLKKKVSIEKAKDLVAKKTKDLPLFEAKQVQKRLAGATLDEVNANYKKILESVREEMKIANEAEEKSLEEEINSIINVEESKENSDKTSKAEVPVTEAETDDDEAEEKEPVEESDDYSDVKLDESEKIDADLMKIWIDRAGGITPFDNNSGC